MQKSICVYSSSSDAVPPAYFQTAKSQFRQLYFVAADAASALAYIESYQPVAPVSKWT